MAWTTEQQRAIDARGNLIVSAAAGAGKTAVLTERVARLVEQGASMDRMLILTFTRAAAGEMKGRIEDRLLLLAREAAGEVQKRLRRQALLCRSAQISTIHAFCARVVNRHFHMAELSPGVTTLDETESAVLMEQAAAEALLLFAREKEETYQTLLRAFDREEKVLEGLLKLHGFLCAQPDRERWLAQTRESLFSGEALQKAGELCMQEGKRRLHLAAKDLQEYLPLIDCQYGKVIAYMQGVLESTERALAAADFYAYTDALEQIPFGVLRFPKTIEAEEKNRIVELRDRLKKCVNDQILLFFRDREQEQAVQNQSAKGLQALFDLWEAFDRAYTQKKKDRDRIDFNDQEHYCARILSDERVAREYRERFDYIIVDEYQDSNRVQEAILQRICREDNLFFVGDVKQSIYGFRMAEPGLFLEKLSSFTGAAGQRADLNCNFRSSQAVLDAVNSVFEKLMGPGMGDILYDETAALKPGRSQPEGLAELHLIEGEDDPQGEPLDSPEAEARFCAEKIRSIMEEERLCLPGGDERPYAYSDFVILLRSTGQARVFARTLALCGVPCYAQLTGGYFESIEVAVFLNLLRIIDNRRQDIPLLSVLRSAMGGFSDEALIGLRSRCPQGEYLDCLLLEAQRETQGQAAAFLERLERYRQMSLLLPVEELVSRLLDDTGFYREMGAMPGGRQRQSNLDALVEKARAYDGTGAFGLRGFLKYMDMARDSDKAGAAQSVTADAVRILSIHKSKGLEFPVVFLCDLGRRFNRRDEQESLLLDGDWGAALSFVDKDRVKRVPLLYKAIRLLGRQRQIEEEMRVLYVAMTRPKGRLYMVGSKTELHKMLKHMGRSLQRVKDVSILGGSRISMYLSWELARAGTRVHIVEQDHDKCLRLSQELPDAMIIEGDGTDNDMIRSENLFGADGFVALTGRDEENLLMALSAQKAGVRKVLAKMTRPNYMDLVQDTGLGSIISPKDIIANQITRYVRALANSQGMAVESLYKLLGGRVEALEFTVSEKGSERLGQSLKDLALKPGILLAAIVREGRTIIPGGMTVIRAGDHVLVVTNAMGLTDLKDILA